jgi:hypothetical protein
MRDCKFDLTLAIMIYNYYNIMDKKGKPTTNNPTSSTTASGGGFMSGLVSSIMGKGNKKPVATPVAPS